LLKNVTLEFTDKESVCLSRNDLSEYLIAKLSEISESQVEEYQTNLADFLAGVNVVPLVSLEKLEMYKSLMGRNDSSLSRLEECVKGKAKFTFSKSVNYSPTSRELGWGRIPRTVCREMIFTCFPRSYP
jgi:hypothetical protein